MGTMDDGSGFELTTAELRAVTRFALASASGVLGVFETEHPDDPRPRDALAAAQVFVDGAARSRLQRVTATDAHRAAKEAATEPARLAARACGDTAAAPYLHSIARATQVGHVLRATAVAAAIAELHDGAAAAQAVLRRAVAAADPVVVDVLRRYPPAPPGRTRVAALMVELDAMLRA